MDIDMPPDPDRDVELGEPIQPIVTIDEDQNNGLKTHEGVENYVEERWDEIKYLYIPFCFLYLAGVLYLSIITVKIKPELMLAYNETSQQLLINHFPRLPETFSIILMVEFLIITYKFWGDIKCGCNFWDIFCDIFFNIGVVLFSSIILFQLLVPWWKIIIVFLNLFTWLSLLHLIMKFPRLGAYILVLLQILRSFLKFAPIFIMFILPFSVAFHILLDENEANANITQYLNESETILQKENDSFLAFFNTFVQTLVMMIGELDFKESIAKKDCWFTTLIFCTFLFLITIFLMNLLTGIAVTDATELLQKSLKQQKFLQRQAVKDIKMTLPRSWQCCIWKVCGMLKTIFDWITYILSYIKVFKWPKPGDDEEEVTLETLKQDFDLKYKHLRYEFNTSLGIIQGTIFGVLLTRNERQLLGLPRNRRYSF